MITKSDIGKTCKLTFESFYNPVFIITDIDDQVVYLSNLEGSLHFRARHERVKIEERQVKI